MWIAMGGSFMLGCAVMAIIDAFILHKRDIRHTQNRQYYYDETIRLGDDVRKLENENFQLRKTIKEAQKTLCN
jgi:hypothetical protein